MMHGRHPGQRAGRRSAASLLLLLVTLAAVLVGGSADGELAAELAVPPVPPKAQAAPEAATPRPKMGGRQALPVDDPGVQKTAEFAMQSVVEEEEKGAPAPLAGWRVVAADRQVVAGLLYHLEIEVWSAGGRCELYAWRVYVDLQGQYTTQGDKDVLPCDPTLPRPAFLPPSPTEEKETAEIRKEVKEVGVGADGAQHTAEPAAAAEGRVLQHLRGERE